MVATLGGNPMITGLAFDPAANALYGPNLNPATPKLLALDPATGGVTSLGAIGFADVESLALDATLDVLYGGDTMTGQLLTLNPGDQLRELNQKGFMAPGGVAVDDDGDVWVADFFSVRELGSSRPLSTRLMKN